MDSLLKLEKQVIIIPAAENEEFSEIHTRITPIKRPLSIPVSRLAEARKHAANEELLTNIEDNNNNNNNNKLTTSEIKDTTTITTRSPVKLTTSMKSKNQINTQSIAAAPFTNEVSSTWKLFTNTSNTLISPAATKANLIEEINSKASVSYPGGAVLPALMTKLSDIEKLLYCMLPPKRTFSKETGETIIQLVSKEPSSRIEVAELHERLIQRLRQRCARESGICAIRREIYSEVFDELIRQITLEEPARGVLLLRVRDEIYLSLAAHRSLAERAMYFASKQRIEALEGVDILQQKIKILEEERAELLIQRKAALVREEQLRRAIEEENNNRSKVRQEEIAYYRRANRQLSQRIKAETERANAHGGNTNTVVLEGGESTENTMMIGV